MTINPKNLPSKPGVYLFKGKGRKVLYVGKSINIRSRVRSYLQTNKAGLQPKIRRLLSQAVKVEYIPTESDFEALILEAHLIKIFQPYYNSRLKDDKRYLYIKITTDDKFPRVTTARKQGSMPHRTAAVYRVRRKKDSGSWEPVKQALSEPGAVYFGPYPSARTVKEVLKLVRRIFPYCAQKPTASRRCFYSHINLCNPCPAEIVKLPQDLQRIKTEQYQNNIQNLVDLLSGKKDLVQQRLKQAMIQFAKRQQYEEAGQIKMQLDMLEYIITHKRSSISKYLIDTEDLEQGLSKVTELRELLQPSISNLQSPLRIEGYDISNMQGKHATGAMAVFINGEPTSSEYKKFRIRTKTTPDDTTMMREVLRRRLKHIEWDYPDLILVDGGKTQVSASLAILKDNNIEIPVIGLAKREETIITHNGQGWREIKLPSESKALQLVQHLRDEAHRFASRYHRKLRSRKFLN